MKSGDLIVALLAGLLGGAATLLLVGLTVIVPEREVSAVEMFAVPAGIGTIAVGVVSIVRLGEQVEEARRQTEFVTGSSPPTMTARYPRSRPGQIAPPGSIELRIVNWNRHAVDILETSILHAEVPLDHVHDYILIDGEHVPVDMAPQIQRLIRLDGWEDRSAPPHVAEIILHLGVRSDARPPFSSVTFGAHLLLLEQNPRRLTVEASMVVKADDL